MRYDILCVGYEFMRAEELYQLKEYKEALEHYTNAIQHYEHADNIYLIPSSAPYQITEGGKTTSYPSLPDMVSKSYSRINKIKKNLRKFDF